MNLVVQRARHPELRDYIHSAVNGLLPFIQKVFFSPSFNHIMLLCFSSYLVTNLILNAMNMNFVALQILLLCMSRTTRILITLLGLHPGSKVFPLICFENSCNATGTMIFGNMESCIIDLQTCSEI